MNEAPTTATSVTSPGQSNDCELSIVMPCLNEAETLETCIRKAQRFLLDHGVNGEVVIGDNGSTDGSQDIARSLGARVIDVPVRGYGAALYHATLGARGRYVIMGDSDDSYDFSDLMPFLDRLRSGDDLVMGNRFLGGIKPGAMPWKNRYLGNPVLSAIGRLFFRCPARDFHCGLRGYSREAFDRMGLQTTGMEFASEMVIKATLLGMKVSEVPTTLSKDGRSRPPHLKPWRDGWRHLRFMFLFSPRWLFLYPGLLLIFIGLVSGSWLMNAPIRIGSAYLDVNALLFAAAAVIIGFQMLCFAVFSKVFAIHEGLLRPDKRLDVAFRYVTLEVGVMAGVVLFLAGLGVAVGSVMYWRSKGFGALDPQQIQRIVIPAVLMLSLGMQVVLASLFLSVLGLRTRSASSVAVRP